MPDNLPTAKKRTWIWPVTFVVVLGFVLFISGLQSPTGPGGVPLIRSADEYTKILDASNTIFAKEIQKSDTGQKLTDDDYKQLDEAALGYEKLYIFNPTKAGPVFACGRIYLVLNKNLEAEEKFRQAILNSQLESTDPEKLTSQIRADSQWYLARLLEKDNDFVNAFTQIDAAVKAFPDRPDYRFTRARAFVQLKKIPDAKQDLKKSLSSPTLDPHTRDEAIGLLHFIDPGSK